MDTFGVVCVWCVFCLFVLFNSVKEMIKKGKGLFISSTIVPGAVPWPEGISTPFYLVSSLKRLWLCYGEGPQATERTEGSPFFLSLPTTLCVMLYNMHA